MTSDVGRRSRFESVAAEVYEPLQRYLRRRANPEDAADALSETLLAVWRRLDDLPGEHPLPWCYAVARRVLANQRRGKERHLKLVEKIATEAGASPAHDNEDPVLEAAVAELPEQDRELIHLWAWEQLEPREIAIVLGTTPNAVSLRLTRVRKKLEARLRRQDPPDTGQIPTRDTEEHR